MYLLRHGQTIFNVIYGETRVDPGVHDPVLTPRGRAQARRAGAELADAGVDRLIVSPYSRALQTAAIVSDVAGVPVSIDPRVRERSAFACDIGKPVDLLKRSWPDFDFSGLDDVWWHQTEEPPEVFADRCEAFRGDMAETPDHGQIAVITHWGVIRALAGVRALNCQVIPCDPATQPPPEGDMLA